VTDVAVCGLAKRLEEVWLPADPDPVILPRTSEGLYLLQRIRDEAHRFAITYHRQKRSKRMVASELDAVPGLGQTRRTALLKHFGSVRKLRQAAPEEIAAVPGMGPRTAAAVVAALHRVDAEQPGSNGAEQPESDGAQPSGNGVEADRVTNGVLADQLTNAAGQWRTGTEADQS
jgi:excinuclease ABC subunit C